MGKTQGSTQRVHGQQKDQETKATEVFDRDEDILDHYARCAEFVAQSLDPFVEALVHDLRSKDPHVHAIYNGHITGRVKGMPTSELGERRITAEGTDKPVPDTFINYSNVSPKGAKLRSSSMSIRNEQDELIGAFCLNMETSFMHEALQFFQTLTQCNDVPEMGPREEFIPVPARIEIQAAIDNFLFQNRWQNHALSSEDKIAIVKHLKDKNLLTRKCAVEHIATALNVTKPSIYNYLKKIDETA